MARLLRTYTPGSIHHLIARFVNREFRLTQERERKEYLRRLANRLSRCDWKLIAYALMSSHVHLALIAGKTHPASLVQSVHGSFAQWLNRQQGRFGPVFAGRFRLWTYSRSVSELLAYIHNNPVRAGVVSDPSATTWTSHHYYKKATFPSWLDGDLGLALSGFKDGTSFDVFVKNLCEVPRNSVWLGVQDAEQTSKIRSMLGRSIKLREPEITKVGSQYEVVQRMVPRIAVRFPMDCGDVLLAVAKYASLDPTLLRSRSRERHVVRARRLALLVWQRAQGPQVAMCAALDISGSAGTQLLRRATHEEVQDAAKIVAKLIL